MRRRQLLFIPCLVSLVIIAIIYYATKDKNDQYQLKIVEKIYSQNIHHYFHDIDHCGFSELIIFSNGLDGKFPHYIIYKLLGQNNRLIQRQYNLKNKWLKHFPVFWGDIDDDGKDELLFFTYQNDSLFIFCGDPNDQVASRFERFIDKMSFREESPDFQAEICAIRDFTGDGYPDVLFWVNAGHSLQPRAYYIYSWHSDTLLKRDMGYAYVAGAEIIDMPDNKYYILATGSYSPQNLRHAAVLSDSVSWLVVLDHHFDFAFPPIPNIGYKTSVSSCFLEVDGIPYIFSLFSDADITNNPPRLLKLTIDGQIVSERIFNQTDYMHQLFTMKLDKKEWLFIKEDQNKIMGMNSDLDIGRYYQFDAGTSVRRLDYADIDNDGREETVCITHDPGGYGLHVYRSGLKRHTRLDFEYPSDISMIFSAIRTSDDHANIAMQFNDDLFLIKYGLNPGYIVYFAGLAILWLVLCALLYGILLVQRNMLQNKYQNERKTIELELMAIKNQVDPHFLYNMLNAIGSYILKNDRKKAYQYLVDFSNFTRKALGHTKDISIMLSTELQLAEQYLQLEQKRLKHSLDYFIILDPEVTTSFQVPRMIIQLFAENAIKHGLMHKDGKGRIDIRIKLSGRQLIIEVEDNGVGRKKASQVDSTGTGMGNKIIEQIIDLYNRLNHTKVKYSVEDITDHYSEICGTKVVVIIPYQDAK